MKIGFLGIFIAVLGVISHPALADNSWCTPNKAPTISVKTSTDEVGYDFTQSEKQLNGFGITTVSPYAANVITDVGGLMKGGIVTTQKMSFGTMTNQRTNEMCFWHDSIEVMLHIKPIIFIANEFPQGSCMHNSIMGHEQKHVMVDREIVNKYAAIIGQALQNDVSQYRVFGPVSSSQEQATLTMVRSRMEGLLKYYTDQMSAERKARQQQIDNINEYERVNKSCKR